MGRGASEMRRRSDVACGIANSEHDQIGAALLGSCNDLVGWFAVFHGHFRVCRQTYQGRFLNPRTFGQSCGNRTHNPPFAC
jgi:hypothetical protein